MNGRLYPELGGQPGNRQHGKHISGKQRLGIAANNHKTEQPDKEQTGQKAIFFCCNRENKIGMGIWQMQLYLTIARSDPIPATFHKGLDRPFCLQITAGKNLSTRTCT